MDRQGMSLLRAILLTTRVTSLPSIWSNCLAGWWLGGGGNENDLPFLFAGVTLIHLGGGFLDDAFNVEFDRVHRPASSIPSGLISLQTAWRWGLGGLTAGALSLLALGNITATLGSLLVVFCVVRGAAHRLTGWSVLLPGLSRFLLYVLGACVAFRGAEGWAIWCGLALAVYRTGVECLAREGSKQDRPSYWPVVLLAAPLLLAGLMDIGRYRGPALLLSAILALWVLRALRQTFWALKKNIQRTVSGLMAGIVLADWLALCQPPRELSFVFIVLLVLTVGLQYLVGLTHTPPSPPASAAPP
jgi:4-hydroxybenzoate polyprenyltransferase